jgi:hypothetical protein
VQARIGASRRAVFVFRLFFFRARLQLVEPDAGAPEPASGFNSRPCRSPAARARLRAP